MEFVNNLVSIFLEASPWLLLGFVAAGLIKVWIPEGGLQRWLGGKGLWSVTKCCRKNNFTFLAFHSLIMAALFVS